MGRFPHFCSNWLAADVIMDHYNFSHLFFKEVRPHGAVDRAVAQRSDDPYVAGSNPTVGRGCQSFR
jgi:hypothetical protein